MTEDTINGEMTMSGAAGTLLAGRYRVVRQLGRGGMGSVWLAEDTKLDGFRVAIKMLPSILVNNKRAYAQVKAEALVSLKLSHPNIATVRAFEEEGGNPFLVMDYIEGQTLDDYLAEKGELGGEDEAIRLLNPIAAALDYAHGQGVVHRDVKPGNVMIDRTGHPYVLDFGIAREIQETMTRVTGKLSSGTLMYMSPEQLHGAAPKPAQDVYSFAAMAYECLTGHPPFSRGQIEYQIEHDRPEPLGPQFADCGPGVMAGLAKTPEARPATCSAVLTSALAKGVGTEDCVTSTGRTRLTVAVLFVLALWALVGGGWWWRERAKDEELRVKREELRVKNEVLAAERAEAERVAEAKAKAEAERIAEEKRKAEAERIAGEKRVAEEKRKAEEKRLEEERRLAEERRLEEEARATEEARKVEEARKKAEEVRRQEEARLAATENAVEVVVPNRVDVQIVTSLGDIELELDPLRAPITVSNFVAYAKSGFYDGTIFHRVIDGFMIQGGGFNGEMQQKRTNPPIRNEAGNGLVNKKYSIAMARTQIVDSATAQFFINVKDNGFLDHRSEDARGFGYAVFGQVTKGSEVVDKISKVRTGGRGVFQDVPIEPVVIRNVRVLGTRIADNAKSAAVCRPPVEERPPVEKKRVACGFCRGTGRNPCTECGPIRDRSGTVVCDRGVRCASCGGSGKSHSGLFFEPCSDCRGRGWNRHTKCAGSGFLFGVCPKCKGEKTICAEAD